MTGAFEIYVSQVAHRTNALIRVLTLIATAVLPAALIVALFSTSSTDVRPLQTRPAFGIMLLAVLVIPAMILMFIRRRRWI